ncbi:MAG: phospholipid carrier-dependent glycosyltransferase [Pirellulales bacterium]|nr:phospholipid carrier-dependent glycosyltransferase [Pirellulales bacterium]
MIDEPASARALIPWRRACWIVLLLAVIVRASVLVAGFSSLSGDPDRYRLLAENLVERGVYGAGDHPSAYRPPLWPLLLVSCVAGHEAVELRVALLQLALGVATVLLAAWLADAWRTGRLGHLAPLLVAIDPILLRQSTLVMTETLAAALAALALAALTWHAQRPTAWRAIAAGVALGLCCLCRPTFLPWLALVALSTPWTLGADRKTALRSATCLTLAAGALLLPWVVRNYRAFGQPILGTTHGGYTLLLGNNPSFYEYARHGAWGDAWDARPFQAGLARDLASMPASDELARNQFEYDQAWSHIGEAPGDFLRSAVLRLGYLFSPLPHHVGTVHSAAETWIRWSIGVFYLAEFSLVLVGMAGLRGSLLRAPWLWGVMLLASFAAVHLFYWTDMRMRAPLVPVVALLAAVGAGRVAACRAGS